MTAREADRHRQRSLEDQLGEWSSRDIRTLAARFGLTSREAEVARLLLLRRSNLEIAEELGISSHTARHHVQSVLFKLGVHSRKEARRVLNESRQLPSG